MNSRGSSNRRIAWELCTVLPRLPRVSFGRAGGRMGSTLTVTPSPLGTVNGLRLLTQPAQFSHRG